MKIHEYFREYREASGLKQKEVAQLLRIQPSTLSKYENGHTSISIETAVEMFHLYKMKPEEFLTIILGKPVNIQPAVTKELEEITYVDTDTAELIKKLQVHPELYDFCLFYLSATKQRQQEMTKIFKSIMKIQSL